VRSGDYQPHRVDWTPERVGRFWDWRGTNTEAGYFSAMAGRALVGLVRSKGLGLSGRNLDFGCGMGHFIGELCAHGIRCEGVDFSAASVQAASARLGASGCRTRITQLENLPSKLETAAFDVVFLLETIEHLEPKALADTLGELARILRVGGSVVVTTPNSEDLSATLTICPDCGAIFHPIQHVSSWNRTALASRIEPYGFETTFVREFYLSSSWLRTRAVSWAGRFLRRRLPNLVYVGRRVD
jgi:2-polyprenyl-3-methyl-5-hydroxy-6-metoxy-1,4-benzoquinol methylase